jgi:hypothetical protein
MYMAIPATVVTSAVFWFVYQTVHGLLIHWH